MNSIGLFGGTFDPIHIGHLITAQSVLEIRNLSKIIFIPAYASPLKVDFLSASSEDRANLVEIAIKDNNSFELSMYEIENQKVSYTIETLKHFKKIYDKLELIIGYDNFLVFDKWKNSDQILQLANVVVLNRKVDNSDIQNIDSRFIFVDNPLIEINSTEIRGRVKRDMNFEFLVPPKVKDYIIQRKLYTGGK